MAAPVNRAFRHKGRRYVIRWNRGYRPLYQRVLLAMTGADVRAFANLESR